MLPVARGQEGPDADDLALFHEAADLVQEELNLLLQLDGSENDDAIREQLVLVEAAGLEMMGRLGSILEIAPSVEQALSPFPSNAGVVRRPNASQQIFYLDVIGELRGGLPTALGTEPMPADAMTVREAEDATSPVRVILVVAGVVAAVAVLVYARRSATRRAELVRLTLTDELTRLSNRRRLNDDLLTHAKRRGRLAVAMIDVDGFNMLNNRHGHTFGDTVLQQIGAAIEQNVRESDVVYRYGGDEFCILLPDATQEEAYAVVERVRAAVDAFDVTDTREPVTVSAGVALGASGHAAETLREADTALYEAKRAGRNRVVQHAEA